jgi:hypothetical protein
METIVAARKQDRGPVYRIALLLQVPSCALSPLALTGWKQGPPARVANPTLGRIVLNTSAGEAFANILTGSREVPVR